MSVKFANLRFLLALGNTRVVVLQDKEDLQIYSKTRTRFSHKQAPIIPEHVAEAIAGK